MSNASIGTACLGLRDGMPITPTEVLQVLKGKGPLEVYSIVATPYFYDPWMNVYTYTYVCNVTFAYVDDCKDAIKVGCNVYIPLRHTEAK